MANIRQAPQPSAMIFIHYSSGTTATGHDTHQAGATAIHTEYALKGMCTVLHNFHTRAHGQQRRPHLLLQLGLLIAVDKEGMVQLMPAMCQTHNTAPAHKMHPNL